MARTLTDEEIQRMIPFTFKKRGSRVNRENPYFPRVPGAVMEHGIPVQWGESLRLLFESINSNWGQGVHFEIDGRVVVDGRVHRRGVTIFFNPDHRELHLGVWSKEGTLWVWNVWDYRPHEVVEPPGSIVSHENYGGMLVETLPSAYRYCCNEGRDDDDYDDLIFRIERTGVVESSMERDRAGPTRAGRNTGPSRPAIRLG